MSGVTTYHRWEDGALRVREAARKPRGWSRTPGEALVYALVWAIRRRAAIRDVLSEVDGDVERLARLIAGEVTL